MYVAVTGSGKARVIQFREDKRIPGTSKKSVKVIKTIGNYEKMIAEDPNIIEKLKAEAKALTEAKRASSKPLTIEVSSRPITHEEDVVPSFHFGHGLVQHFWKAMHLDTFFLQQCGKKNAHAVAQALLYLISHRCMDPTSVRGSVMRQPRFAGVEPLGLDVFYSILDVLAEQKEGVIKHLCDFFTKKTDRTTPNTYLDVTTYAFESTRFGELRMFGFSKDRKHHEVQVVMALLIDSNGIPITYELFPGNTMDQNTLIDTVERLKKIYHLDKITLVADRGLNGGNNLLYLNDRDDDFVISYTLKRSKKDFEKMLDDETEWQYFYDEKEGTLIRKEKVLASTVEVTVPISPNATPPEKRKRGRPPKYEVIKIPVNIHLTYSPQRARKDQHDRERILTRLKQKLEQPSKLKSAMKRGGNQYLDMTLKTEEWTLDEAKIQEAERFDGYYAIITNNLTMTTPEACDIYRGLWRIKESFRILKSDLRARPVFVWNDAHIKGHFLMCYISLCLLRYMQYLLEKQHQTRCSAERLMRAIKEPLALVQGDYPHVIVTPTRVSNTYLELTQIAGLPALKTNMTLTQFRASTKLDLNINLK